MYRKSSEPAPALPELQLKEIQHGISLIPPLSRLGHGPGIITLVPDSNSQSQITDGVPWPSLKLAEEGYAVVEIQACATKSITPGDAITSALSALKGCVKCDSPDGIGIVAYSPELWKLVQAELEPFPSIVGAVVYGEINDKESLSSASIPILQHLAGKHEKSLERNPNRLTRYYYPAAKSYRFALPFQDHFDYVTESVSHTRNLTFLKALVKGPYFDLEDIWEEHTHYEFTDRSVEHTMSTMVQEPYVNHIPTLTGGIGRPNLTKFYRENFIFKNSADTGLELISRTVGIDRIVDEFIFKFTHDREIDWLLPGVPPTGMQGEIPMTAIVNIRGDRLYHEHISWDQATVLRQLGLLPEYLPFPYTLQQDAPHDVSAAAKLEYRVPALGVETAQKMRSKTSVPSNEMFNYRVREA